MFVLVQLASIIKWNLNILNASKDRTEESVQNFTTHDMLISIFVLHQPGGMQIAHSHHHGSHPVTNNSINR